MGRHRKTGLTLALSRIYMRHKKYAYFSREPLVNPTTGRTTRWHVLCHVADGELRARMALDILLKRQRPGHGTGNFSAHFEKWKTHTLQKRDRLSPKDAMRLEMWRRGTQTLLSVLGVIERAFADFDLDQIRPVDVAVFVDQWEGRRSAQTYKNHLVKFFRWCARTGLVNSNPALEVAVEEPVERNVVINNEQYHQIRDQLLVGEDGKRTRTGEMVQVYMDLLYLLYQRGTDVRLLQWSQISADGILFKPTKTERSSGKMVRIPMTAEIEAVLDRARSLGKAGGAYVIQTEHGQPYTAHGIGTLFSRARARAGIKGITLKDIRSTAASDAESRGFSEAQIQIALAHTDLKTTRLYLRGKKAPPVSEVVVPLPKRILVEPANTAPGASRRRSRK